MGARSKYSWRSHAILSQTAQRICALERSTIPQEGKARVVSRSSSLSTLPPIASAGAYDMWEKAMCMAQKGFRDLDQTSPGSSSRSSSTSSSTSPERTSWEKYSWRSHALIGATGIGQDSTVRVRRSMSVISDTRSCCDTRSEHSSCSTATLLS